MDTLSTSEPAIDAGRRRRRRYSEDFKSEAVAACRQPGVSVAAIALARGLNANLLRRWVAEAERAGMSALQGPSATSMPVLSSEGFVPVALPSAAGTEGAIRIEVRRGSRMLSVQWPVTAARECAQLLREFMR